MTAAHPWTGAEVRRAVALRQRDGLDFERIAALLGRTVNAVRSKLCSIGRYRIGAGDAVPPPEADDGRHAASVLAAEIAAARREAPALAAERRLYRGGWP